MNGTAAVKRVWSLPDMLSVEWADGTLSEFASLWLRDNLREDRDPHNGQRLIDIADLPEDPKIRSALAREGSVKVEWESEPRSASFELEWLLAHAANRSGSRPEFRTRHWLEGARLDAAHYFVEKTARDVPRLPPGLRPSPLRTSQIRRQLRSLIGRSGRLIEVIEAGCPRRQS